ncbi:FAD-dependent monooxygenase, partial [Streptomyces sp. NPDC058369]|uniref:FAD-dependent monooxygenase n=1 Tax=Streptomyces sp. NPDC058369 TaxID=3346462 RepID=UPI00365951E0
MELNSVKETGVLIVGAGPCGLALACDLARRGVRALVVERVGGRGARPPRAGRPTPPPPGRLRPPRGGRARAPPGGGP